MVQTEEDDFTVFSRKRWLFPVESGLHLIFVLYWSLLVIVMAVSDHGPAGFVIQHVE